MSNLSEPQALSLQDVISEIQNSNCYERTEMLEAAELVKSYFNRPAHEITLNDLRDIGGYFLLYLSFRRFPLAKVDTMLETVNRVAAKFHVMQLERSKVATRQDLILYE